MNKNLKSILLTALVAVFMVASPVLANGRLARCDAAEAARYGATHVIVINAQDMVNSGVSAVNTAVAFTNTVAAYSSIKFAGYVLKMPFETGNTLTSTNAIAFSCGITSATTKWISSVEVANDATPTVYGSFGTYSTAATALTLTTNQLVSTGLGTNNTPCTVTGVTYTVSGATATTTMTDTRVLDSQTSAVNIICTMGASGSTGCAPTALEYGEVRVYFAIMGKNYNR